jgi:proline iminopeptidase
MRHVLVAFAALALACAGPSKARSPEPTLRSYFASDAAVKAGGARMVPIKTPKGEFRVWTKRFGNNPRIKLLLLHGGPGGTHEYLEAFESLLAPEGIEFI